MTPDGQAPAETAVSSPVVETANETVTLATDTPMPLDKGSTLGHVRVAYITYGTLNTDRSNAILVCHGLTGDQYAASTHPITGKPGWWQHLIGPGRVIDTDRYYVICTNVIGGCMGSSGPQDPTPDAGAPYGIGFPVVTIGDMVRAQKLLIDHLGIKRLFSVIGGSMGAMQALQWSVSYPDAVFSCIPIAGAARHSAQNIAFHEVGRQAIMADPDWQGGAYYHSGKKPTRGLSVARMAAHITYLSETALHRKFGRSLQDKDAISFGFDADFQVESYLRHQGITFVDRFDANSYLYITRAMDYFDLTAEAKGSLTAAFEGTSVRFKLISFTSDWLFPTAEALEIVHALNAAGAAVSFVEIETDKGHDSFLLSEPAFEAALHGFLSGTARLAGLASPANADTPPTPSSAKPWTLRQDLALIADIIPANSRVLDIGCGHGELLSFLVKEKHADARGLEIDGRAVGVAIAEGLAVIQGDANTDLNDYRDGFFDYVTLSLTLQTMRAPEETLQQLLRIGRSALVSISNFAFWPVRLDLSLFGKMPKTKALPYEWWNTPNIHHTTIKDFLRLCRELDIQIEAAFVIDGHGNVHKRHRILPWDNLLAETAIFLLRKA